MRRALVYSRSYRAAVLATNPVAYWRLGEATVPLAVDEMGAYDGTYVGSPTLGAAGLLSGDPNTAVTFAAGKYVNCGTVVDVGSGDASFGAWIQTTDTTEGRIISKRNAGAGWDLGLVALGAGVSSLSFYVNDGAGHAGSRDLTVQVNDGARHYVVAVRQGTQLRIHVDGAVDAGGGIPLLGSLANGNSCFIGELQLVTRPFIGTIDEPKLWNRALSVAEIARLYTVGRGY